MKRTASYILSIHDDRDDHQVLAIDFKHILVALRPYLHDWVFCITHLDAHGTGDTEALCTTVEETEGKGIWMTAEELIQRTADIAQTIDGEILAFPKDIDPHSVTPLRAEPRIFPC